MSVPAPPPPSAAHYGGDPTNVMGRRIGAYLIDAVIGTAVFVVAFFVLADSIESPIGLCGFDESPTMCADVGDTSYYAEGGKAGAIYAIGFGYWFAAGALLQGLTGGTPGKLMVGLRVVNKDTGALGGVGRCAARTVLWVVDAFPYVVPLVGLITGVSTKGHRRVGDMAAGTLVVGTRDVGRPPQVPGVTAPVAYGYPTGPGSVGGAWTPPPPMGVQAPPPPQAPAPEPGPSTPVWDADRGAYVQWDQPSGRWLQYDDASGTWRPI